MMLLGFLALLLGSPVAHAQLQRSIVNPSFELPFTGPRAAQLNPFFLTTGYIWIDAGEIQGWETTHRSLSNICGGSQAPPYTCTPIEIWANEFSAIVPPQGIALAELNAVVPSKLYQNICLFTGETFTFNFAHRGRGGVDRAQFQVGATDTVILDFSTGVSGTGVINGGGASGATATGIANGWTRYAGTYTYTGPTGLQVLGYSAVSAAGGDGVGNFLDDINIQLKPFATFVSSSSSAPEGSTGSLPQIKVVGVVPAGGLSLTLTVSGTASFGSDFNYTGATTLTGVSGTATSLQVTVPAGNYSDAVGGNVFTLPINVIDDAAIEDNETIILTMPPNGVGSNFVNANSTVCGGAVDTFMTHAIVDNDVDLRVTKTTTATGTQAVGSAVQFTVTYANVTPAVLTAAPLNAHDAASVAISDPAPSGITLGAWTCTASGTSCPAASGSGAISQTANLPVGASLTYVIQATVGPVAACAASATNTASIATTATSPSGATLAEGTSVQGNAGYVFGPNSASAALTLASSCADVTITKSNSAGAVTAGQSVTYDIVVSNAGPASASNTRVQDPAPTGLNCTSVSCTAATGGASCASLAAVNIGLLQGSGIVLNTFPATSSYTFQVSCTVSATGQ